MKTLDAIKKLNAVKKEDGELLLATPIDMKVLKGAKEQDLAEAFMNAIESIPSEDEEKVPDELADVYNALAEAEKTRIAETESTKPPVKKIEKTPEKKVTKAPEKKADKKSEKPAAKVTEKKSAAKTPIKKVSDKKKEPSRKCIVYQFWIKNPKKIEDIYKFAASIGLSTLTAKSWIGQWNKGKNLPAGI